MKKNASSKILLSLGVATLLYSGAFAAEITFNSDSDLDKYFDINEKDNVATFKNENYKNQDLTFKINTLAFDDTREDAKINIDLGNNSLTLENTRNSGGETAALVRNFNVDAKDFKTTDIGLNYYNAGIINANLTMVGSGEDFDLDNIDKNKASSLLIFNGSRENTNDTVNGSLTVNGDFSATNSAIVSMKSDTFKVNGIATIEKSGLGFLSQSYSNLDANDFIVLRAKDIKTDKLNDETNAGALILKSASSYIDESLLNGDDYVTSLDVTAEDNKYGGVFVDYKLSVQNCGGDKCLVINGGATAAAKNLTNQIAVDLEAITRIIDGLDNEQAKEALEKQKTELEKLKQEAQENGGKIDDEKYIDLVNKNSNLNLSANDKASILVLRSITEQLGSIGADLASREGVKLALQIKKDTDNTGKSVSNLNSASSAVNTTMNISNDVSIGSRVAMLNNPFGTYASKMNSLKFAALDSDMRPSYVNEYTNSVWANAFGGANIIDGDSGAMYGATVGVDKQANDNVLWGAYFTYANAKIKDNNLEQKSDNFQLGMYSTINVAPQWELNLKAYAQVSPTKQDNIQTDGAYNSDYTSKFLGVSANAGRVFDFSDNTLFIKPFAGINYYFSYTPSHTENGAIAKDIDSMKNNSVSVEVGAEFRKYMNENSYIFVTPKIEQFVINRGDDYTANLAINNAFFTSVEANNKKKTYGQIIVGGNIDFTNQLSMNLGFGAKQILAGKVDNKNETYLSGQVGLKYKF
ncbi:autotransporter outer membrane beta-barrel domain-containing protein [Campylobacter jejuni]|uniref:autotransporter adhesin CapC n=1 Tax=Campylobacter jejuni TaxID=197 RepID=UPI000F814618|nr:autotransporter adhesin CapC [Campylobacter jejuni]RTI76293.1 autotransporter outer membrane beta-barrel domain-containing protein [Campylobacter jejuni]RTI90017.1 autotransporter outer membrane beta-barrel domain-containing protein [Campylobacter jejuni]RTJ17252.1 autotransporter outer membrane beta-barrel domain-containing protein [Campylobacter jejuni]RTJ29326.1 autotransporter outer membrane beta-barrel domain-containing protein [Campylobacter jejuni]RTJ30469.1 autotransporter outer mem